MTGLLSRRALLSAAVSVLATALLGSKCSSRFAHSVGPDEGVYVASREGDTYHLKSCLVVKRIQPRNLLYYKTGDYAYKDHFRPCGVSKPDQAGR